MRYAVRRTVALIVALTVSSIAVFAALRILPGDLATVMAGTDASAERVAQLRVQLGLNHTLPDQYVLWLGGLLHGDLGTSMLTGATVTHQIGSRASVTLPLVLLSMAVSLLIGVPAGCQAALARGKRSRSIIHAISLLGGAVPAIWAGMLLILLFGSGVGVVPVLPSQGFPVDGWSAPLDALRSLALPALTVGIIEGAQVMRYVRSGLSGVMDDDAVMMAMAGGMTRREAAMTIGMRLAMPQLVSVAALELGSMITGVMVVESLFALPGLGAGLVSDVGNRDLVVVQSELFLLSAVFLVLGFLVDMAHRALDPRVAVRS
ncbi:ABC transporter permease [uncultured Bifidobacterium sp.]|uniref:ABC transporter permease n=1 Tax=uncultured Bifidobacterium sp. TaxID=165187 RepID=UPI002632AB27|nr:ABC transporter permease [uncultured Bifidobacterium sp.]